MNVDLNRAIAGTRFIQDLSTVLYGVELGLKHMNASETQMNKIQDEIVKNIFSSLEFNFESLNSFPDKGARSPVLEPERQTAAGDPPRFAEAQGEYDPPRFADTPGKYNPPHFVDVPDKYDPPRSVDVPGKYDAPGSDIDFFEENIINNGNQSSLYSLSEKTYDSHMDDDEDFERPTYQSF